MCWAKLATRAPLPQAGVKRANRPAESESRASRLSRPIRSSKLLGVFNYGGHPGIGGMPRGFGLSAAEIVGNGPTIREARPAISRPEKQNLRGGARSFAPSYATR